MPKVLAKNDVAEMLRSEGISRDQAHELANEFDGERVQQAIEHFHKARLTRELNASWIAHCLRGDWLPFILFDGKTPVDRASAERLENLKLTEKHDFIRAVSDCIKSLERFQWEWLAGKVAHAEQDEWYQLLMFRNPTRSNWILCEKAHSLYCRGALKTEEYRIYLEVRRRRMP